MTISQFLRRLAANNNREWFNTHRDEYDEVLTQWYDGLDRLIGLVSEWEPRLRHVTARDAAYRIYRDTRFSLDKTPYKTHFSAILSPYGKKVDAAAYYLQVGTTVEDTLIAGGAWCMETATLKKLRKAVVDNIEEFNEIISDKTFNRYFPEWYNESLKTAPKGWPKDHPNIDLLRLTGYCREHYMSPDIFDKPDWPEKVNVILKAIKPLNDFCNYSLFEE
ncbi:MAG: DUF2461 domain-containing protein [Muribaculaceae bacterium]|nr:DUF2461 domain-containing protein [Muribaculaceae bacterium]